MKKLTRILRVVAACAGYLSGANLRGADLSGVNLSWANLREADLRGANLGWTYLSGVNLRKADLRWAILSEARLSYANFEGASLSGTVLDPSNVPEPITDETLLADGFRIEGDKVYGWRTKKSQHCGATVYEPGKCYEAPVFSTCTQTACHPGIYLAGREWIERHYPDAEVVQCYCLRSELVHVGDKFRTKRLWII